MGKFVEANRSKFAQSTEPTLEDFTPYTLAWAIQFYLEHKAELKQPVGDSQSYAMRAIQVRKIGAAMIEKMEEDDFLNYATHRIHKDEVAPSTVNHDFSDMRVVLAHCKSFRKDCKPACRVAIAALDDARPQLVTNKLVGKSEPRRRRTLQDEFNRLRAYFLTPAGRGHARLIPMWDIMDMALASARRLGEICRITWGDVDFDKKVYTVRDLKHPTKKKGNDKTFALFPEIEAVILRQPRLGSDPKERVFPYRSRSITSAYCNAKKPGRAAPEGIENLHFHDLRAEAISRWKLKLKSNDLVRNLVSGHETDKQIDSVYDRRSTAEIMALVPEELMSLGQRADQVALRIDAWGHR